MNESTWLKEPTQEMVTWVSQDIAGSAMPLSPDAWRELLEDAGLKEIEVKTVAIEAGGGRHDDGFRAGGFLPHGRRGRQRR
jgi:hypothetical protein